MTISYRWTSLGFVPVAQTSSNHLQRSRHFVGEAASDLRTAQTSSNWRRG